MSESCSTCKYMRSLVAADKVMSFTCNRSPPVLEVVAFPTREGNLQWANWSGHPVVGKDHWCGEWKPNLNS